MKTKFIIETYALICLHECYACSNVVLMFDAVFGVNVSKNSTKSTEMVHG